MSKGRRIEKDHRKKKKTNRVGRWVINIIIVLMLLIGGGLIFNKAIRNFIMYDNTNKWLDTSAADMKKNIDSSKGSFDFEAVRSVDFNGVLQANRSQDLPVIGGIAIPDVGINLPIFKGVGNLELMSGAGTMKEDQVMGEGNYALASHNVTGYTPDTSLLFTPLEKSKVGQTIYLTDKQTIYEYKTSEVFTVLPTAVQVIDDVPGQSELTLVTCADAEAKRRIIVKAEFVKSYPFDGGTEESKVAAKAFEKKYNQFNV